VSLNYITILFGFIISFFLFNKFPQVKKTQNKVYRKVSIIIPSRNEENNIENILSDLEKQDFDIQEIICVDDNSTDSTAEKIKKHDVKYLLLDNLPKGWKGKTWACQNGALAAIGDLLLFIDADVRLSKSAVSSLVAHYSKQDIPLSVQPYHTVNKLYEFYSFFFNFIQVCVTYLSVYKKEKYLGFYGPVFLVDRELFLEKAGYSKVKNEVVEDLFLGKYYNSIGIDIDLLLGGDEIKFKMYPKGFAQLLEGWSKNFSKASVSISSGIFVMMFLWIGYILALPVELVKAILAQNLLYSVVLASIYIITVLKMYRDIKKIGSYPLFVCILFPVYLLAFLLIFLYSIFGTYILKTTTWKGRKV
jgi:4,4'-diaponeurosporenoate glycosyltransferase